MELQYWIWIAVGLSFSLYIGIAIWSRAGSTKEFYVAGGGVHPIANGYGNGSRLDVSGLVYIHGRDYIV
jgi:cation/acetate symporter